MKPIENASTSVYLQRIVDRFTIVDHAKSPIFSYLSEFETHLTICANAYRIAESLGTPLEAADNIMTIFISGRYRPITDQQFRQFIADCRHKMGLPENPSKQKSTNLFNPIN